MRHRPGCQRQQGVGGGSFPLHPPNMDPEIFQGSRHAPGRSQGRGSGEQRALGNGYHSQTHDSLHGFKFLLSAHPSTQESVTHPTPLLPTAVSSKGPAQRRFRLQSPFSRFLFPERTFLLRNLHHFSILKKSVAPLLPGLIPSSRGWILPLLRNKSALGIAASGDPQFSPHFSL